MTMFQGAKQQYDKSMRGRREARKAREKASNGSQSLVPLTDIGRLHPALGPQLERSLMSTEPGSAGYNILAVMQLKPVLDGIHQQVGLFDAWQKGYLNYAYARVFGVD